MKDQRPPPPIEITIDRVALHGFADPARVAAAVRRELARLSTMGGPRAPQTPRGAVGEAVADAARAAVEGAVSRAAFGPKGGRGR
jgi:hypothetical protein